MHEFKESLSLYLKNMHNILLLIVCIILPLQIFEWLMSATLLFTFGFEEFYTISLVLSMFISFVFLNLYQSAFVGLASIELIDENASLLTLIKNYWRHMISVLLYSILCALGVFIGIFMFVIPGLIMLVMMIFYPYVLMIDGKTDKSAWSKVYEMTKNHSVKVVATVLLFVSFNFMIWYSLSYLSTLFVDEWLVLFILRLLINVFMIPLFVFYITNKYYEWSPESVAHMESGESF